MCMLFSLKTFPSWCNWWKTYLYLSEAMQLYCANSIHCQICANHFFSPQTFPLMVSLLEICVFIYLQPHNSVAQNLCSPHYRHFPYGVLGGTASLLWIWTHATLLCKIHIIYCQTVSKFGWTESPFQDYSML